MTTVCPIISPTCNPCPDDQPVLNLSAEAPDQNVFMGVRTYPQDPVIGDIYNTTGCLSWCYSTVSQAAADACAQAQAASCATTDNGSGTPGCPAGLCGDPDIIDGGGGGGGGGFLSARYALDCPSGTMQQNGTLPPLLIVSNNQLVCPEGSFTSPTSQSDADFLAVNYTNTQFGVLLSNGTIECLPPWIFSGWYQIDNFLHFHDINPDGSDCPPTVSLDTPSKVFGPQAPSYISGSCNNELKWLWRISATKTIGPYAVDKFITLSGQSHLQAFTFASSCGIEFGSLQTVITATNLVAYTGDFTDQWERDPGTGSGINRVTPVLITEIGRAHV